MQISKRVSGEIRHKLLSFNDKNNGLATIISSYTNVVSSIDVEKIYAEVAKEFDKVITSNNYLDMLRMYNRKSLLTAIGEVLGLKKGEYVSLIIRISKGKKAKRLFLLFMLTSRMSSPHYNNWFKSFASLTGRAKARPLTKR